MLGMIETIGEVGEPFLKELHTMLKEVIGGGPVVEGNEVNDVEQSISSSFREGYIFLKECARSFGFSMSAENLLVVGSDLKSDDDHKALTNTTKAIIVVEPSMRSAHTEDALRFAKVVNISEIVQLVSTEDENLKKALHTQTYLYAKVNQNAGREHQSATVFSNHANARLTREPIASTLDTNGRRDATPNLISGSANTQGDDANGEDDLPNTQKTEPSGTQQTQSNDENAPLPRSPPPSPPPLPPKPNKRGGRAHRDTEQAYRGYFLTNTSTIDSPFAFTNYIGEAVRVPTLEFLDSALSRTRPDASTGGDRQYLYGMGQLLMVLARLVKTKVAPYFEDNQLSLMFFTWKPERRTEVLKKLKEVEESEEFPMKDRLYPRLEAVFETEEPHRDSLLKGHLVFDEVSKCPLLIHMAGPYVSTDSRWERRVGKLGIWFHHITKSLRTVADWDLHFNPSMVKMMTKMDLFLRELEFNLLPREVGEMRGVWVRPTRKREDPSGVSGWSTEDGDGFCLYLFGLCIILRMHGVDATEYGTQAGGVAIEFLRLLWSMGWEISVFRFVNFFGGRYVAQIRVRKEEGSKVYDLGITMLRLGITYPSYPFWCGTEVEIRALQEAIEASVNAATALVNRLAPLEGGNLLELPFMGGLGEEDDTVNAKEYWEGVATQDAKEKATLIVKLYNDTVIVGGEVGSSNRMNGELLFKEGSGGAVIDFDKYHAVGYNVWAVHTSEGFTVVPCAIFPRDLRCTWGMADGSYCFLGNFPKDTKENLKVLKKKKSKSRKRKKAIVEEE